MDKKFEKIFDFCLRGATKFNLRKKINTCYW